MAQEDKKIPYLYIPISLRETIEELNDEEKGKIFEAIFEYADTGSVFETDEKYLKFVFLQLKNAHDKNVERYKSVCEKNKINALHRWKSEKTIENKGQNATAYDRIPPYTTAYDRMRWLPNKNKKENKIKSKNKIKIENKNKINKKEKNIMCVTHNIKKEKDGAIAPTPHTYDFSFILSIGQEMGIDEVYCKKFYDYYNDVGWITAKGEPIKNVKMALRIWHNKDIAKVKSVERRNIDDDTKRVFGDI